MESCTQNSPQFENLCEALRGKIKAFKRENPRLSGLQIAKIFGMASSTLNRIENRSISTPSIDQVVKVLRGVGAHDELIQFMDSYYPEISDTFKRHHLVAQKAVLSDRSLVNLVLDQSYFKIFVLSVTGEGILEEEILRMFGENGLEKANFLVQKGILKIVDNKFSMAESTELRFDSYSSKELMIKMVENFYRPIISETTNQAMLSVDTCSVKNGEVAKRIVNILKKARADIFEIVDDENNKGDCKYFFTLSCDLIK